MILRPGIAIKKEENEKIFVIKDSNVIWIRQGSNEFFCSVPENWVNEVVAITMRDNNGIGEGLTETIGISVGKVNTGFCQLQAPADRLIGADEVQNRLEDGKMIYNGSIYKLIN